MEVRRSKEADIDTIMEIYENAKRIMIADGNPTQWNSSYPSRKLIEGDIKKQQSYVLVEQDEIVGTFAFIIGEEPTYQYIEDGEWIFDTEYGTIHRLASGSKVRGVAKACFDFCKQIIPHLRIDTHPDNNIMQRCICGNGFQRCGIIYVDDGSKRYAYEYMKKYKI